MGVVYSRRVLPKDSHGYIVDNTKESFRRMGEVMDILGLDNNERKNFHATFDGIDANGDVYLSRKEFSKFFTLHNHDMTLKLFDLITELIVSNVHRKPTRKYEPTMDVVSFFIGVFHYSLRSGHALLRDFFRAYSQTSGSTDLEAVAELSQDDFEKMVLEMNGEAYYADVFEEIRDYFLQLDRPMISYEDVEDADFGHDVFEDLYNSAHSFRGDLQENVMLPIFANGKLKRKKKWKIWMKRKHQIIENLRADDFTNVAECYFSTGSHQIVLDKDTAKNTDSVNVLDHVGHKDSPFVDKLGRGGSYRDHHKKAATRMRKRRGAFFYN